MFCGIANKIKVIILNKDDKNQYVSNPWYSFYLRSTCLLNIFVIFSFENL